VNGGLTKCALPRELLGGLSSCVTPTLTTAITLAATAALIMGQRPGHPTVITDLAGCRPCQVLRWAWLIGIRGSGAVDGAVVSALMGR
jgi:hypothetical protein